MLINRQQCRDTRLTCLAVADQLLDAALQLALFLLALAQPLLNVGDRKFVRRLLLESDADEVVAPPDDFGEERTAFSRDRQRYLLFRQPDLIAELEAGAVVGGVGGPAGAWCRGSIQL